MARATLGVVDGNPTLPLAMTSTGLFLLLRFRPLRPALFPYLAAVLCLAGCSYDWRGLSAGGLDAGVSDGGSTTDGAVDECETLLVDEFEGSALDNTKWMDSSDINADVSVATGFLSLSANQTEDPVFASVFTGSVWTLEDTVLTAEVRAVGGKNAIVGWYHDDNDQDWFGVAWHSGAQLQAVEGTGPVTYDRVGNVLSASDYNYWRVRSSAGQIHLEVSEDLEAWDSLHVMAATGARMTDKYGIQLWGEPSSMENLRMEIFAVDLVRCSP